MKPLTTRPDKISLSPWPLRFPIALVVAAGISARSEIAQAQQLPACIYQSESYSDGAYLCVQRSLMLKCAEDSGRLQWKIVSEPDVSHLCAEHNGRTEYRASLPARRETSGKCFYFGENRYCE
jgi:hypothetical protein